ncbi:unnamed protein product [Calypogeia fissa]
MSLEVPVDTLDDARTITHCRLSDKDAKLLQPVKGQGKLAYEKIPNLAMRSLVKYGTSRILLKCGYDHVDSY